MKKTELIKAAKELNGVVGCDPAIKVKKVEVPYLIDQLNIAGKLVEEGDVITEETAAVLAELAGENEAPETHETAKGGDKDLTAILAETKKLADLKALVEDNDEFKTLRKGLDKFKGLNGPRELRPLMEKCLGIKTTDKKKAPAARGKEKKAPTEKKEKKSTAPIFVVKYARPLAIITAILSGETNKERLIKQAVKFIETTNKVDDTHETTYFFKKICKCLATEGLAEETDTDLTCKSIK